MTDKVFEKWDEIIVTIDLPVIISISDDNYVKLCPGDYRIIRLDSDE